MNVNDWLVNCVAMALSTVHGMKVMQVMLATHGKYVDQTQSTERDEWCRHIYDNSMNMRQTNCFVLSLTNETGERELRRIYRFIISCRSTMRRFYPQKSTSESFCHANRNEFSRKIHSVVKNLPTQSHFIRFPLCEACNKWSEGLVRHRHTEFIE